jgi:hypothetical protein
MTNRSLCTNLYDVHGVASRTFPISLCPCYGKTRLKVQKVVMVEPLTHHGVPQAARAHAVMLITPHIACKAHRKHVKQTEQHSHMAKCCVMSSHIPTCHLALANHISFHLSGSYVMQESSHLQIRHANNCCNQALYDRMSYKAVQ